MLEWRQRRMTLPTGKQSTPKGQGAIAELTESGESLADASAQLGQEYGILERPQFLGHLRGWQVLVGQSAKRRPGGRNKVSVERGEKLLDHVFAMLAVPLAGQRAFGIDPKLLKSIGPIHLPCEARADLLARVLGLIRR